MGLFPQSFIDDLRLQANILQIVQEYVPLRKAGTRYKGLCPFHAEKTPSFSLNAEKGVWHCYGCDAGGDLITFVRRYESVDFNDALRVDLDEYLFPFRKEAGPCPASSKGASP